MILSHPALDQACQTAGFFDLSRLLQIFATAAAQK
jgi:hypothetical protein